jgi:hypothetical protein
MFHVKTMTTRLNDAKTRRRCVSPKVAFSLLTASLLGLTLFMGSAAAQTDCADGDGVLDMTPPKNTTAQEIIQKLGAGETKGRDARALYSFTQDVLVQTLDGKSVDGQFHEITHVSYDSKGKRVENVTFGEQSTLHGIALTAQDFDDIRTFMPWMLPAAEIPRYKITYAGQQHVDDLDTYVFHVEPATIEKNTRYYQGRIWVDNRDFQIVKLCGKSVPDAVQKKNKPADVRPTFVSYRKFIDGNWLPAYARVDDTLHFQVDAVHLREIVKLTDYKRSSAPSAASKP